MAHHWDLVIGDTDATFYNIRAEIAKPGAPIVTSEVERIAESDPFWANRGKAIQGYASLERALCQIFVEIGGMKPEVAGLIFYKTTNHQARNSMIEKMIHLKHGNTYNLFWNSFFKLLRPLDIKRNEIVHWNAVVYGIRDIKGELLVGVCLKHPDTWGNSATNKILSKDLVAFTTQCEIFRTLVMMFMTMNRGEYSEEEVKTWPGIYQRPVVYPLPADHPIFQMPLGFDSQPQSSDP